MNRNKAPKGYDENPEWTEQDFAKAKPASKALPKQTAAALVKNKGGRPKGSDKEQVSLRIDREALNHFRAGGSGPQTRINEVIRKAAGL